MFYCSFTMYLQYFLQVTLPTPTPTPIPTPAHLAHLTLAHPDPDLHTHLTKVMKFVVAPDPGLTPDLVPDLPPHLAPEPTPRRPKTARNNAAVLCHLIHAHLATTQVLHQNIAVKVDLDKDLHLYLVKNLTPKSLTPIAPSTDASPALRAVREATLALLLARVTQNYVEVTTKVIAAVMRTMRSH